MIFSLLLQIWIMDTHQNSLKEVVWKRTHNLCFWAKISDVFPSQPHFSPHQVEFPIYSLHRVVYVMYLFIENLYCGYSIALQLRRQIITASQNIGFCILKVTLNLPPNSSMSWAVKILISFSFLFVFIQSQSAFAEQGLLSELEPVSICYQHMNQATHLDNLL